MRVDKCDIDIKDKVKFEVVVFFFIINLKLEKYWFIISFY